MGLEASWRAEDGAGVVGAAEREGFELGGRMGSQGLAEEPRPCR